MSENDGHLNASSTGPGTDTAFCVLVYKFKKIVDRRTFRKFMIRYKRIGCNLNVTCQSACLVFKTITVNNYASLFNCTLVGRASDSMMVKT